MEEGNLDQIRQVFSDKLKTRSNKGASQECSSFVQTFSHQFLNTCCGSGAVLGTKVEIDSLVFQPVRHCWWCDEGERCGL